MTRPEDIPADVWEMAHNLVHETWDTAHVSNNVARVLLAYGQRRADEARERAARVCEEQASAFLSPEYASAQPMSSLAERFACSECANGIRSQK